MAAVSEYEVLHPVRHNGHLHARGTSLRLTSSEGSRLVQLQVARPREGGAVIEVGDEDKLDRSEFLAGLQTHKRADLIAGGLLHYGMKLSGKNEEMVAQILNAEQAAHDATGAPIPVTTV